MYQLCCWFFALKMTVGDSHPPAAETVPMTVAKSLLPATLR